MIFSLSLTAQITAAQRPSPLDQPADDSLRPFLGKKLTLRGTLFAAIDGHHHTPVLLDVVKPVHVER
jgi:hypothetical protein